MAGPWLSPAKVLHRTLGRNCRNQVTAASGLQSAISSPNSSNSPSAFEPFSTMLRSIVAISPPVAWASDD